MVHGRGGAGAAVDAAEARGPPRLREHDPDDPGALAGREPARGRGHGR